MGIVQTAPAFANFTVKPRIGSLDEAVRKTASFFEFSLCLSRACLGKMMVFIYNWLKNAVFRRRSVCRYGNVFCAMLF